MVLNFVLIVSLILISLMIVFYFWIGSKKGKGRFAEIITFFYLKYKLDLSECIVMENITIPDGKGGTTQIDHILISPKGIFVIELKYRNGYISGNKDGWNKLYQNDFNKKNWYVKYNKNSIYHLQNPFHQNLKHIKCLSLLTGLDESLFYNISIIVAAKNKIDNDPIDNLYWDLNSFLNFYNNLNDDKIKDVQLTSDCIWKHKLKDSLKNKKQHIEYVKEIIKNKDNNLKCKHCNEVNDITIKNGKYGEYIHCSKCDKNSSLKNKRP